MPASDRSCARLHDAGERRDGAALDHAAGTDAAAREEGGAEREAKGACARREEARAEAHRHTNGHPDTLADPDA